MNDQPKQPKYEMSKPSVTFVADTKPNIEKYPEIQTAEQLIVWHARISSPENREKLEGSKLLKYLIEHKHWSPFEMASLTLEIDTSLDIATQMIRHRSFSWQQLSRRYKGGDIEFMEIEARLQDTKNRQNSIELTPDQESLDTWLKTEYYKVVCVAAQLYQDALDKGISKEVARKVLPVNLKTTLDMTGTLRSWIHYIDARTNPDTQKEHRWVAEQAKKIFIERYPIISKAKGWIE